jgi:hypothetical protein
VTQHHHNPSPRPDESPLKRHRVAFTVIVDADGVDSGDAHNVAAAAISNALKATTADGELTTHTHRGHPRTAQVITQRVAQHDALRSGTLTLHPANTTSAW